MILQELLNVLDKDTEIGILDMDKAITHTDKKSKSKEPFSIYPSRNKYHKVKNLTFKQLQNILSKEVMAVYTYENGLFIRVYDKKTADKKAEARYKSQIYASTLNTVKEKEKA